MHNLPDRQRNTPFVSFTRLLFAIYLSLDIHSKGVIHRDIKPENILFGEGNVFISSIIVQPVYFIFLFRIKIADLGIARIKSENTTAMTQIGTQPYMSPELFKGQDYEFPVDIWALGVIAYEMCTLKHPFLGCSPAATMHNILHITPPPIPHVDAFHPGLIIFSIFYFISVLFYSILSFSLSPLSTQSILRQPMYSDHADVR